MHLIVFYISFGYNNHFIRIKYILIIKNSRETSCGSFSFSRFLRVWRASSVEALQI